MVKESNARINIPLESKEKKREREKKKRERRNVDNISRRKRGIAKGEERKLGKERPVLLRVRHRQARSGRFVAAV